MPLAKAVPFFCIAFAPKLFTFKVAAPVLAFTYDANNDYVYDAANSTQFDFPQVCLPDIANLIYEVMAGNLKSQLDLQIAQQRKVQGI